MKMKLSAVLGFVVVLSACGGGGSGADTALAPKGTYTGAIIQDGTSYDLAGIVPENGSAYFYSIGAQAIYVASIDTDGSKIDAAFDGYAGVDGSEYSLQAVRVGSGSFSGTVLADSFTASFSTSFGDTGTLNLAHGASNALTGSLAAITGTWALSDSSGDTVLSIAANGSFAGSDDDGCQYSGSITASSAAVNAYSLTGSISCPGDAPVSLKGAVARGNQINGQNTLPIILVGADAAAAAVLFEQ